MTFCEKSIFLEPLTIEELKDIVSSLKNTNSTGHDGINNFLIKKYFEHIGNPLLHICNKILTCGIYPNCLKRAIIVPIYKGGDRLDINNYRPISLTPSISKIIEKVIKSRLMSFFLKAWFADNLKILRHKHLLMLISKPRIIVDS